MQSDRLDADNSGNIILTGYYTSTVDFNPGAGTVNFSANTTDTFVAKYNSSFILQSKVSPERCSVNSFH